ncbi:SCO1664 family protein [Nocardioides insulae]|uniref:SCO1664 family protein n=1 Tax=Nocardioides insulae TaxID=394734 RepID=UPI000417FF69|nr:SCO1664 family protein [Nocardioides insulae]
MTDPFGADPGWEEGGDVDLAEGELRLHGRVMPASNATFVGTIGEVTVVYKPIAGERPLWDFPEGNLARREVAAYRVSEATGWGLVPTTWLREGPHGPGMVQRWIDTADEHEAVTLVPEGRTPEGYLHVFDGLDAEDRPISLIHEDTPALRRIAVLDTIINNADRKGGHVLEGQAGHRWGIDHGIAFHREPKLRTVLWGWAGEPISEDERDAVTAVLVALAGDLGESLAPLLADPDLDALERRCVALLQEGTLPIPTGEWPPIPWPPF